MTTKRLAALCAPLLMLLAIAPTVAARDAEPSPDDKVVERPPSDGSAGGGSVQVPVMETQGGSNNYVLLDSNDDHGPSASGPATGCTPLIASGQSPDDDEYSITLPFAFNFYGTTYAANSQHTVGVNGAVVFNDSATPTNLNFTNTALNGTQDAGIYAFWDDLQFFNSDLNRTLSTCQGSFNGQNTFSVAWFGVSSSSNGAGETNTIQFEIVLFEETQHIEIFYDDTEVGVGNFRNGGASATVGLSAGDGSTFLQYSHDVESLAGEFSIRLWQPTCGFNSTATAVGTRGNDTGSINTAIYYAHHGNDDIEFTGGSACGGDGNDTLTSSPASTGQSLYGDEGFRIDPWAFSHSGKDILNGSDGEDRLYGGPDVDTLNGNGGADVLIGFADLLGASTVSNVLDGRDTINGGDGDDFINGDAGNDILSGGDGDDTILGGPGGDTINGGADNDILFGNAPEDTYFGDWLEWSTPADPGGDLNDNINGGTGNDELNGGPGDDNLYGQSGTDTLNGEDGDDKMWGGSEDDVLDGGGGEDTMRGNNGDDVMHGRGQDDRMYGNGGDDELNGNAGDDRLFGNADSDELNGGIGNDSLFGSVGIDTMNGDDDDDLLNGGDDNDIMNGGDGTDTLRGGRDNDLVQGDDGDNDLVAGGSGDDTLSGGAGIGDICRGNSHIGGDSADASCEVISTVP